MQNFCHFSSPIFWLDYQLSPQPDTLSSGKKSKSWVHKFFPYNLYRSYVLQVYFLVFQHWLKIFYHLVRRLLLLCLHSRWDTIVVNGGRIYNTTVVGVWDKGLLLLQRVNCHNLARGYDLCVDHYNLNI